MKQQENNKNGSRNQFMQKNKWSKKDERRIYAKQTVTKWLTWQLALHYNVLLTKQAFPQ